MTHPAITAAIKDEMYRIRHYTAEERRVTGATTLSGIRDLVQIAIEDAKADLEPEAFESDRSFEGHFGALRIAAANAGPWGASESQVRRLAAIWADRQVAVEYMGRLTAADAAAMIRHEARF